MWKKALTLIYNMWIREEGTSVVETAVIVPMIWVMVMGSTFLFFFFFDMGVIRSETIHCAREAALEYREGGGKSVSKQKELLAKRINGRLLLARLESSSLSVSLGTVTAKADIRFFLGGKGISFSDTAKVAVDQREDWVRLMAH